jgi:prepilin-type processing-associated H-X9-DG protein
MSTNNLKQIGLAAHYYQEAARVFPPGGTISRRGQMQHGWQTLLLPYLEHKDLYDRIDTAVAWDDPRNAPVFQTIVAQYRCPKPGSASHDAEGRALSYYAGNAHVLGGDCPRALEEITDGTSNTIAAGEVANGFKPWGHPANWRDPALGLNRSPAGFGSLSPGGATLLFVDGSVKFVKSTVDPKIIQALGTPNGGETVSNDAF